MKFNRIVSIALTLLLFMGGVSIAKAQKAQDGIKLTGGGDGPFEAPDWNTDNLAVIRKALNDVAAPLFCRLATNCLRPG